MSSLQKIQWHAERSGLKTAKNPPRMQSTGFSKMIIAVSLAREAYHLITKSVP